jgi:hypothetical protein
MRHKFAFAQADAPRQAPVASYPLGAMTSLAVSYSRFQLGFCVMITGVCNLSSRHIITGFCFAVKGVCIRGPQVIVKAAGSGVPVGGGVLLALATAAEAEGFSYSLLQVAN